MIRRQLLTPADPNLEGAFDSQGRTAPTATCLEGLLAALEFLPTRPQANESQIKLRGQIDSAVEKGIAFLMRAQIKSGPYAGGMPAAIAPSKTAVRPARGASEVRIDFVQHALCAWLRYEKLFMHATASGSANN